MYVLENTALMQQPHLRDKFPQGSRIKDQGLEIRDQGWMGYNTYI